MQLGVDCKGSLMMEVDTYALQQLPYLSFVYRQDKAQVTKISLSYISNICVLFLQKNRF